MQIKIITNPDERFMNNWLDLYLKSDSSFFDNPYWIMDQKESDEEFHIITVWDNKLLISVFPLKIAIKKYFFKRINVISHCNGVLSDYKGIIHDKSINKASLAKVISKEIYSFRKWDYLEFRDIDSQKSILNSIFFSVDNHSDILSSKIIDEVVVKIPVNDFRLPKKMKWEINNSKKKLENNGIFEITHTKCIERNKILSLLKVRAHVYQESNDLINLDDIDKFINLIECEKVKGEVIYSELLLNDEVISQHIGFVHNNEFYYYMPIFDRKYSSYSPGKILLCELINYCRENDIEIFNFLRGGESYKWNWAEITNFNYSFFAALRKGNYIPKILCIAHKVKDILRVIKR